MVRGCEVGVLVWREFSKLDRRAIVEIALSVGSGM